MAKRNGDPYSVGYGKPPADRRFKPGQSGNPKGRPKGTRSLEAQLREELNRKISVSENGMKRRVRKFEVMLAQLTNKAAQGDYRAIKLVTDLMGTLAPTEQSADQPQQLSPEDTAVLDGVLARVEAAKREAAEAQILATDKTSDAMPGEAQEEEERS